MIVVHGRTLQSVEKAKSLIAEDNEDSQRYACLQLRMAIEHLYYELIPLYEAELPTDIRKNWQPKEIMKALLECDPHVEEGVKNLVLFDESPDGSVGNAMPMGSQTGVTLKLIKDYYHWLGFYLHAPIDGKAVNVEKLSKDLRKLVEELTAYSDDRFLFNVATKLHLECEFCGHAFQRKVSSLEANKFFQCTNADCRAVYECLKIEDSTVNFRPVMHPVRCPNCDTEQFFPQHALQPDQRIKCDKCEAAFDIRMRPCLVLVSP